MTDAEGYIRQNLDHVLQFLTDLAVIPAPCGHEEKRAAFCADYLKEQGAEGVVIDDAKNVLYPVGITAEGPVTVFAAHSDVVFPDTETLPLTVGDGQIRCPGIGDNTANAAALLTAAGYVAKNHLQPKNGGILFAVNSGEEGLGNLKGIRRIMDTYGTRTAEMISFDDTCGNVITEAIGSRRYRICVQTKGGHSFSDFGAENAIEILASLIEKLYALPLPREGKVTYNVGTISGGTSVNAIAQQAEMLYEYRFDSVNARTLMEQQFLETIRAEQERGIHIRADLLGERPCTGDVDADRMKALSEEAAGLIRKYYGLTPAFLPGSTDCSLPLSMGIPAVCLGCCLGRGSHTREEFIRIDSIVPGLLLAFEMILKRFQGDSQKGE